VVCLEDLALGHVRALDFAARREGFVALNLGTGHGASVLQLLQACERAIGRPLPFDVCARRAGDTAEDLCRGRTRGRAARMAGDALDRRQVYRRLALATGKSRRL
jgi:UDP-glucose 4-epimerase